MFVEVWFFCCYCLCLRWILTILNTNKTHLVCTNRDHSTDRSVAWCVCVCAVSSVDGIISSQLNAQSQSQPSKCAIHSSTLVHGNWCFCCQFTFEINGKHKYVFVYIYICAPVSSSPWTNHAILVNYTFSFEMVVHFLQCIHNSSDITLICWWNENVLFSAFCCCSI